MIGLLGKLRSLFGEPEPAMTSGDAEIRARRFLSGAPARLVIRRNGEGVSGDVRLPSFSRRTDGGGGAALYGRCGQMARDAFYRPAGST
jgi:hypothetical protein